MGDASGLASSLSRMQSKGESFAFFVMGVS